MNRATRRLALPEMGALARRLRSGVVLLAPSLIAWLIALLTALLTASLTSLMMLAPAHAETEFLDPAVAFKFSAGVVEDAQGSAIAVRYRIADGYYMYREQFAFAVQPPAQLGAAAFPPSQVKFDQTFQKNVEYYRGEVLIRIPLAAGEGPVSLTARSQGCADAGLCYSPQEARITLSRTAASAAAAGASGFEFDDSSRLAATLGSGQLTTIVLLFFGLGLLLAFTPCMLPMVPILSSVIVGQGGEATRTRGFTLALSYTLGMAVIYTAMGIAAGLAGEGLAAYLQNPWVLGVSAALLVAFALSMFGLYTLQAPAAVQSWLNGRSGRLPAGRHAGVFSMGALSALIVGPCVAAPLAGALVYISQTGDTVLGGTALFAMAIGMGSPLLLIGLSAGALLPRAGPWMEAVKRFFGVLLLAVALWMIAPLLPTWTQMLAWAGVLAVAAAFLRVFDSLPHDAHAVQRVGKGLGVLLMMAGAALVLGVATGGRDLLQPLAHLRVAETMGLVAGTADGPAAAVLPAPSFERIRTSAELDQRLTQPGRPVMLDFYADWCVSCKEMERYTYTDARVAARMAGYRLLQVDVTENTAEDRALLKRFGLFGPPGILFFDRAGKPVAGARVIGFQSADKFFETLEGVEARSAARVVAAAEPRPVLPAVLQSAVRSSQVAAPSSGLSALPQR